LKIKHKIIKRLRKKRKYESSSVPRRSQKVKWNVGTVMKSDSIYLCHQVYLTMVDYLCHSCHSCFAPMPFYFVYSRHFAWRGRGAKHEWHKSNTILNIDNICAKLLRYFVGVIVSNVVDRTTCFLVVNLLPVNCNNSCHRRQRCLT
jgi:hypothetical protein